MRAVIDTCVMVDALQSREPFCGDAQKIFLLCAVKRFDGRLTAKSVTDIYYLTHRLTHSDQVTRQIVAKLCTLFALLDTAAIDVREAIGSGISDFEDAVMIETAVRSGADCIVTRNKKDYRESPIPVYAPAEFVKLFPSDDEA